MKSYIFLTDSCADLSPAQYQELDISMIPLTYLLEEQNYENLPDESNIPFSEVYHKLRNGANIKTSAINVDRFTGFFRKYLEQGLDILYLGFSSGLSGTYSAGCIAAQELAEEFPQRTILTVDTLGAALGQGLMVYLTALKRKEGATLQEAAAYAEDLKLRLAHWFTVDDLFFLKRGGRLSGATALIGSALGIKPILHVDNEGHLVKVSTVRGRKNSLKALADQMAATAIEPEKQTIFIGHGDCREDAELLAQMIREGCGYQNIHIGYVGPVIGAHSGPGTIALFFVAKER
ncbi:MAG: DegV family protein [Oscillospiraceae bacterium]|nr:DegV family protein [Oscillospiraceae bacterium]